jgi:rubredoxin
VHGRKRKFEDNHQGMWWNLAQKYQCTICGYIYDPENGDSDSGVKPGTAFEDLPDTWICPQCGASKEDFEKVQ